MINKVLIRQQKASYEIWNMYQLCVCEWVSTINNEIHAEVISTSIAYVCIFYNFSIPM